MEHSCCSAVRPSSVLVWHTGDIWRHMPNNVIFALREKRQKILWMHNCTDYLATCSPGLLKWPISWLSDCRIGGWSVFISLFIDSLAFLWVFEINNSQQKSDRGMKISTFPAVKPFIKLTRGRIGREEWGGGCGREAGAGRGGGRAKSGTGVKGNEATVVWDEEESCGREKWFRRWHLPD